MFLENFRDKSLDKISQHWFPTSLTLVVVVAVQDDKVNEVVEKFHVPLTGLPDTLHTTNLHVCFVHQPHVHSVVIDNVRLVNRFVRPSVFLT